VLRLERGCCRENMFFNIKILLKSLVGKEKGCNFALAFETEVSLKIEIQLSV
jgi:hypothetical protein